MGFLIIVIFLVVASLIGKRLEENARRDAIKKQYASDHKCPPHKWAYSYNDRMVCSVCNFVAGTDTREGSDDHDF